MASNLYEELREERKALQEEGKLPPWYTTAGYQLLKDKYLSPGELPIDRYRTIAKVTATHAARMYGLTYEEWYESFFWLLWKGILSPATPVLANLGTNKGLPVSCSGNYIHDSIDGFYSARKENALLTKYGFGTSSYLGGIRPRGFAISNGGKASGVLPVIKGFVQDMSDVSQGFVRRGSWAGYLEVDHGDFHEVADYLLNHPDGCNIGWIFTKEFITRLDAGDQEALERYQRILKIRAVTGKGYIFKVDHVNDQNPKCYKESGLEVRASNLCTEITLVSDTQYTFSCVLSSLNLAKFDEWPKDAVWAATIFLDCVAEEFIERARDIEPLGKIVNYTERFRSLGLGVLGFHTYLQKNWIPFDSMEAYITNNKIFSYIEEEAVKASEYMASMSGSPFGGDRRNSHLTAIAPTMSTALLMGGVSQGIEPVVANVWNQNSAGGEVERINPVLLQVLKDRNIYTKKTMSQIIEDKGSIKNIDKLGDKEKEVFKTAYEINQKSIIRMASSRQRYIDQGQSLNLFFSSEEDEEYISEVHREAIHDPYIKALYYMRSSSGVDTSTGECTMCEG